MGRLGPNDARGTVAFCGNGVDDDRDTLVDCDDSDCPDGDWGCMLDQFSDLSLPSGYARYTIECMNAHCTTQCFGG